MCTADGMERKRFSQTMASEWQTAFAVSHKMSCSLPSRITTKVLKTARLFLQDRDQDFHFYPEAPRDQDPGLEDYITGKHCDDIKIQKLDKTHFARHGLILTTCWRSLVSCSIKLLGYDTKKQTHNNKHNQQNPQKQNPIKKCSERHKPARWHFTT